jgi:hypothetical protein
VDVYLDYVRVDDEWAHFLFNPGGADDRWNFPEKITGPSGEGTMFANNEGFGQFYIDEFQYNNIECIVETKRLIESASGNKLTAAPVFNYNMLHGRNMNLRNFLKFDDECIDDLISKGVFDDFIRYDVLPFVLSPSHLIVKCPHNLTYEDNRINNSYFENLYNNNKASNSEEYNFSIEDDLEFFYNIDNINYYASNMHSYRVGANALKRARAFGKDIVLSCQSQLHAEELDMTPGHFVWREPTNEEISLLAFLGVIYGAKQSILYEYNTTIYPGINGDDDKALYGLADADGTKRTANVYKYANGVHQNKWDGVKNLNIKLKAIGDYMYPAGHPEQHLLYDDSRTVNTFPPIRNKPSYLTIDRGLSFKYILDIVSLITPGSGQTNCNTDFGLVDCPEVRYWEFGFFNPNPNSPITNDNSKYFIALNKRCTPVDNIGNGDVRTLKIRFKPSELAGSNSWKLIDPVTGYVYQEFNKNSYPFVNAGIFQPGEGKLFKLVSVTQSGGNLQCDENIQGGTFYCEDTIFTNGHNLTIGFGTTINFSDSGCIVVNGGNFICGDVTQPTHTRNIIFRGNSNSWSGLTFNGCGLVNINSAQFQNVKGEAENTNYAVKMINCSAVNINNCTFTNADPQKSGAIESIYSGPAEDVELLLYISGNTFNMNTSDKTIVSVIANSGSSVPAMLDNNIFTSTSSSATAMYLAFVSGVEISGNAIVGYNKAIEMHYSNIDVIGNSITSTTGNNSAKGIDAQDFSTVNLTSNGAMRTGGMNIIDNVGENEK